MPSPRLTRKDQRQLEASINQAFSTVHYGYLAWEETIAKGHMTGRGKTTEVVLKSAAIEYPDHHLESVADAQRVIVAWLARIEDKDYFNLNIEEHNPHILDALWNYEAMATNLLEDIASLRGDRQEEAIKGPSGQWTIYRSLLIEGKTYGHAVGCNNPAFGTHELDLWEKELRGGEFQACPEPAMGV